MTVRPNGFGMINYTYTWYDAKVPINVVAQSAPARQRIVGPVTPDQHIAEMEAVGTRLIAGRFVHRDGSTSHMGYWDANCDLPRDLTNDEVIRERQLRHSAQASGADFNKRVAARLYELGKAEDVGPFARKLN